MKNYWAYTIVALTITACMSTKQANPDSYPAYLAATRLPLEVCQLEGIDEPLLCGVYSVFENRAAMSGRRIPIKVVVVPAQQHRTTESAWIEHPGGPRYSVVRLASAFAEGGYLEAFRRHRDIVLADPRGLHESGPLYCEALKTPRILERYYPPERVKACREELEQRADLAQYSTLNAIDDYEDIRRWLGYPQWDVGGWSYGSRFMLTYLHQYPQSIRSMVLMVPSILNFERPVDYARFGQRAFDAVAADCAADLACHAQFPDVAADLNTVLDRLATQPHAVEIDDPYSKQRTSRLLTRDLFAEMIWVALLQTHEARQLPFVLRHAATGNYEPFLELAVPKTAPAAEPEGHYFSVVCPEETGRLTMAKAEAAAVGTFTGAYIAKDYLEACQAWGLPLHPGHPIAPRKFATPALIITGDQDPVTPPEYGATNAAHFDQPLHLTMRHIAHRTSGVKNIECLTSLLSIFVDRADTRGLDTRCIDSLRPPPFRLN